jgi:hypothetical protein
MIVNQFASSSKYSENGIKYNNYMVSIEPPKILGGGGERNPIMVSLVIDISYSMDDPVSVENVDTGITESNGMTILDIVKHAAITVINSLTDTDYASVIVYSNSATVISGIVSLSDMNKVELIRKIRDLRTTGQTNIWDGLYKGMETLRISAVPKTIQTLMLLTDGQSNTNPPQGIIPMLQKYKDSGYMGCSINTFGFGYNLDSNMLRGIAEEGHGMFAFCPDANFVGTTFCNILSNEMTTYATDVTISLTGRDGYIITKANLVEGDVLKCNECSWGVGINLGSLRFGQSRNIVLQFPDESSLKSSVLKFIDISKEVVEVIESNVLTDITPEIQINIMENQARSHVSRRISPLIISSRDRIYTYKNLVSILDGYASYDSRYIDALMKEVMGQIEEALQTKYYTKWGRHYIQSLQMSHMKQESTNFKDHAVQFYGGDLFKKYRNMIEDVFVTSPPAEPSNPSRQMLMRGITPTPTTHVSMRNYFNQSGGCIAPSCVVKMSDGQQKRVDKIRVGDKIAPGVVIQYVVKFKVEDYQMVYMPTGLIISPYHPIKHDIYAPEWSYPCDTIDLITQTSVTHPDGTIISAPIPTIKVYNGSFVYNFVLNNEHIMLINDIQVITLGHDIVNNNVLTHPYLGTRAVIEDLENIGIDENGCVNVITIDRDSLGHISGFK